MARAGEGPTNKGHEAAVAAHEAGATYVDLYRPFQDRRGGPTGLLADDGDHPSARGHALTAEVLMAAGLPGLTGR